MLRVVIDMNSSMEVHWEAVWLMTPEDVLCIAYVCHFSSTILHTIKKAKNNLSRWKQLKMIQNKMEILQ